MGNLISKDNFQGLVVQDDRVINANLASKDAAAQPSIYTQLNPKPTLPSSSQQSNLTLKASNEQSEDGYLEIVTNRAGHPIAEQAGFVWRDVDAGDTTSEYKGWDGYQAITGWNKVRCSNAVADDSDLNIIRLQSGNMLIAGIKPALPAVQPPILYHYDVDTSIYTERTVTLIGSLANQAAPDGPGLLQLPSGRILYFANNQEDTQVDVYFSDDEGDNWDIYAMSVLNTPLEDHNGDTPAQIKRIRVAYSAGEVCMLVWYEEASTTSWSAQVQTLWDVAQYASDDLGQTFTYQGNMISDWNSDIFTRTVRYPKVLPQKGGGFWMGAYKKHRVSASASEYFIKRIPTAFTPFLDETDIDVYTFDQNNVDLGTDNDYGCAWWVDEDGTYYGLLCDKLSDPVLETGISCLLVRSLDAGVTWEEFESWTLQTGAEAYHLFGFDADCTGGKALVPTRWIEDPDSANAYAEKSVTVLYLGGFSTHTLPAGLTGDQGSYDDTNYAGWGNSNDTNLLNGRCWIPIGLPNNMSWLLNGVGGTATLECDLTLTSAGNTIYYLRNFPAQAADEVIGEFALKRVSGGSQGSDQLIYALQLSDAATYWYGVNIRMDATGFTVRGVRGGGNTVGSVVLDMNQHVHVRIIMNKGYVRTWYAYGTDELGHVREWIEGPDGAILPGGASGLGDACFWGHQGAGVASSEWTMAAYNFFPGKWGPRFSDDEATEEWTNYTDLHPRSYSPIPALLYDRVKLSAQSGPTRLDEEFEVIAGYDYPVSNLDPRISPSPNETWRGDDEVNVEFVWEMDEGLGDGMLDNIPFCIMALNTNIKAFTVDYWDGAAYQPLGTAASYDGWTGLKYVRAGNRYTVDVDEATTGKNYFYYEQHAGDSFLFDNTERPAKIEHNTEGAWYSDGNGVALAKLPRLVVDKDAVSGAASSGTGQVWRKNFGLIVPDINPDDIVKLRFSITAHATADDYYEIGAFVIGALAAFGQPYDNGWQIQDVYNNQITQRIDGQRRVRNLGKKRKIIDFSFADIILSLCDTQTTSPQPNYVYGKDGATDADKSKSIYASENDVSRTVTGFVERAEQAKIPVLLFRNIPFVSSSTDEIIFTKTLDHVYGRIVNDPQIDNVYGTELENEFERLNTMTIEEEV